MDAESHIQSYDDSRTDGVQQLHLHCLHTQPGFARWSRHMSCVEANPARALMIAQRDDVVCVNAPIDEDYLDYLQELELGCRRERIVVLKSGGPFDRLATQPCRLLYDANAMHQVCQLLSEAQKVVLSGFQHSDCATLLCETLRSLLDKPAQPLGGNASEIQRLSHKHFVRELAVELGVPVAPGETVEVPCHWERSRRRRKLVDAITRQQHHTGRVIVRGTLGSSGFAVFTLDGSAASLHDCIERIDDVPNEVYLVEAMYQVAQSPNVVLWIEPDDGRIKEVVAADQSLTNSTLYAGNRFPSMAERLTEMRRVSMSMAECLQGRGVNGYVGFDFCEYLSPRTGKREHVLAEINPRINGSVYSHSMMRRLNAKRVATGQRPLLAYQTAKAPFSGDFGEVSRRLNDLLYRNDRSIGAVPIHFPSDRGGVSLWSFMGETQDQVAELNRRFQERLDSQRSVWNREKRAA